MVFKKLTIRRMPPVTRKYARLLNELDSVITRGQHLVEEVRRLEMESKALYNRKQGEVEKEIHAGGAIEFAVGPDMRD